MRIVTARSPSASPSRSSSPFSSKKRPPPPKRWRRVDCVVSFPSSKRVQGTPRGNRPAASNLGHRAPPCPRQRGFQDCGATSRGSPNPKAKSSVWQRVSGVAAGAPDILCEDLVVCATATKKCDLGDPSQDAHKENWPDGESKVAQMDIDPQPAADGTKGVLAENRNRAVVDVSHKFTVKAVPSKDKPRETDPHKISQRQKQIDYGKNTLGYERYLELVPRSQRKRCHPQTPNIKQVCSKRSWDGQVKKWRRLLHEYDPPVNDGDESPELFSLGGGDNDGTEDQDNRGMAVDSEGTPTGKSEVGTIYDDWDAMEP